MSSEIMKIIFIIDLITYGGAPRMIISIAEAMSNYGHEVSIFSYASEMSIIPIPPKVNFIKGKKFIKSKILRHIIKIGEIRKVLANEAPDVVISFMPYPSILSIVAKIGLGCKVIVCERGDPSIYKGFINLIGHRILRFADGAVFQTEGARNYYYNGNLYRKSTVIPNAVTLEKIARVQLSERNNEIAFVGRFDIKQKRQDLALIAFSNVLKKYPTMKLVFYGDGEDIGRIERLASDYQISSNVLFLGKVDNIHMYLKESRMFLLTSDYEGIPNALIEAMCVGLPCVATDCSPGGARLLIDNFHNGILVPSGDIDAISAACIYVLDCPEEGEKFGIAAQNISENFSPSIIYPKWESYIKSIMYEQKKG